jgi:hypothetical protein
MASFPALRFRLAAALALLFVLAASGCASSGAVQGRGSENGGGGRAKVGLLF